MFRLDMAASVVCILSWRSDVVSRRFRFGCFVPYRLVTLCFGEDWFLAVGQIRYIPVGFGEPT